MVSTCKGALAERSVNDVDHTCSTIMHGEYSSSFVGIQGWQSTVPPRAQRYVDMDS
jgi:hypothetical protein